MPLCIVIREGTKVIASIVDKNLKPDAQADSLKDKICDIAVGIGAIGLFSKIRGRDLRMEL